MSDGSKFAYLQLALLAGCGVSSIIIGLVCHFVFGVTVGNAVGIGFGSTVGLGLAAFIYYVSSKNK
jgi:hypothetical protein